MPQASAGVVKYAWMDHEPALIDESPVQNTWYEVYHDYDVRQLMMSVKYYDDEVTGANLEIRWTCDGNVYTVALDGVDDSVEYYIYKTKFTSAEASPLTVDLPPTDSSPLYRDKRALDFLVEIRATSVIGTNAHLIGRALYETLELT